MHTIGLEDSTGWEDSQGAWDRHLGKVDPPCSMSVCFVRQGNFTLCELVLNAITITPDTAERFAALPPLRAFGMAKRCPRLDTDDPDLARQIAFGRACKALAKEVRARLAFDRDNRERAEAFAQAAL